jgi:hypothetical protein
MKEMTTMISSVSDLSDRDLLVHFQRAAADERHATTQLIALLTELDARRLYLGEGCSSLFTYCTKVLHLSEHAAYGRIEAARAARRFPVILELLAEGAVTLTTIGLLAPHLTAENHAEVFASARHKSKREVEQLVARLHPRPDLPATVRKLPPPKSSPGSIREVAAASAVVGSPLPSTSEATIPMPATRAAEMKPLAPAR